MRRRGCCRRCFVFVAVAGVTPVAVVVALVCGCVVRDAVVVVVAVVLAGVVLPLSSWLLSGVVAFCPCCGCLLRSSSFVVVVVVLARCSHALSWVGSVRPHCFRCNGVLFFVCDLLFSSLASFLTAVVLYWAATQDLPHLRGLVSGHNYNHIHISRLSMHEGCLVLGGTFALSARPRARPSGPVSVRGQLREHLRFPPDRALVRPSARHLQVPQPPDVRVDTRFSTDCGVCHFKGSTRREPVPSETQPESTAGFVCRRRAQGFEGAHPLEARATSGT